MNRTHRDIPRARRARRAGVLAALAFAELALVALVPPAAVAAAGGRSDDGLWTATFSAQDGLTQGADDLPAADDGTPRPLAYHVFAVNAAALGAALDAAPLEEQVAAAKSAAVITLPLPDGAFARYRLVESPILGPEVQKILPDMRTYLVQGLDDPTASGRLDYSSYGFHAMVHGQDGTLVIDPVNRGRTDLVLCAWERDFVQESEAAECVVREMEDQLPVGADKAIPPSGAQLREYRLALTGTDEYFCHFDPTGCTGATPKSDAAGVAAMTTTVNRVNSIYEKEASIRFIFTHLLSWWFPGGADPFPNGANTSLVLEENRTQTQAWPGEAQRQKTCRIPRRASGHRRFDAVGYYQSLARHRKLDLGCFLPGNDQGAFHRRYRCEERLPHGPQGERYRRQENPCRYGYASVRPHPGHGLGPSFPRKPRGGSAGGRRELSLQCLMTDTSAIGRVPGGASFWALLRHLFFTPVSLDYYVFSPLPLPPS